MSCNHQPLPDFKTTSSNTPFKHPYNYATGDLVDAIRKSIDPKSKAYKVQCRAALSLLFNTFKDIKTCTGDIMSLIIGFRSYNILLFLNSLPEPKIEKGPQIKKYAEIFKDDRLYWGYINDGNTIPEVKIIYHEQTDHEQSERIPLRIDRTKAPIITIPRIVNESGAEDNAKQHNALLEAVIEYYLQWFSCGVPECQKSMMACGRINRGKAWQDIASSIENSDILKLVEKKCIKIRLISRRKNEFERELSYWGDPIRCINDMSISEWGWESKLEDQKSIADKALRIREKRAELSIEAERKRAWEEEDEKARKIALEKMEVAARGRAMATGDSWY